MGLSWEVVPALHVVRVGLQEKARTEAAVWRASTEISLWPI